MRISSHAKKRFKQRAGLFLYPEERKDISGTMKSFINLGHKSISLEQTPFYKNKIGCDKIMWGRFHFYIKNNTVVTFVLKTKENKDEWRM